MNGQVRKFEIGEDLLMTVMNYLATKPYNEVAVLLMKLQNNINDQLREADGSNKTQ